MLTTHYMEEADRLASQLAIVDQGRIVARGTPDELKAELEGDAVQVELAEDDDGVARTALERIGGLGEVLVEGRTAARPRRRRRRRDPRRAGRAGRGRRPRGVRSRSRARRSTTSICATPGGPTSHDDRRTPDLPGHASATCASLLRQPAFIVITLIQPLIWLLLFGALFKAVTQIPGFAGTSYIDYLTPGVVVMLAVSSAGWTGMAFIEDMNSRRSWTGCSSRPRGAARSTSAASCSR